MPKKTDFCIKIEGAENGVVVTSYMKGHEDDSQKYVYKNFKEAVKELKSVHSVLVEESPDMTKSDLKKMEEDY